MFSLFRKNLPFCRSTSSSSSSSSQVLKFFNRFKAREFSSSPPPPPSEAVKVFAWWDVDSCGVPSDVSFSKVAPSITAALRANGIMGDVEIQAWGYIDSPKVHDEVRETLESTGIPLYPCYKGETSFTCVLAILEDWLRWNPPPAHLFFIFGDVYFSGILNILNKLRMRNYNILLACPDPKRAHVALCHAATIMWQWSSMLKGEDLIGKHFNYPPDDPFNSSWYGNSNVPLKNPFSVAELHTSSQNAEIYKSSSDIKVVEASKSVSRQVMKILSSHPKGISIGDLRAKLIKCDPPLGKRFYGYKKFSNILISIPHVQLEYLGEGNFWVCLVSKWTSTIKNKQEDTTTTQKLHNDVSHPPQPQWDNIRVSVWWDFDSCPVPSDVSFLNVAPSIMGVLRANGIKGPIHIDAYGDVSHLSEIQQEALFFSGIDLHHIPGGKKNSHKWLLDWACQNPPPGHLFLISVGDTDFYFRNTMYELWSSDFNILLACPRIDYFRSHDIVTIVWQWSSMLKGKYFTGKYYGYPPRGYIKVPHEYPPEWYRNSKVLHENPFSTVEEPTSSKNAEIHKPSSYIKLVEVPKSLCRQVRKILSSYPNGVAIGDLHLQFKLSYLHTSGRGFYTQKEFSNILVSIPHVQLLYIGEGDFCVRLNKERAVKNKQKGVDHPGMPALFSSGSFWDDVESFVFTSRRSRLISRSISREDLAHKLQKHGPLSLMSLTRNDILRLVELLIAEKKWLEESPSQAFPFRLTRLVHKIGQSHGANGFRSL